jgi:hypothetical protein
MFSKQEAADWFLLQMRLKTYPVCLFQQRNGRKHPHNFKNSGFLPDAFFLIYIRYYLIIYSQIDSFRQQCPKKENLVAEI